MAYYFKLKEGNFKLMQTILFTYLIIYRCASSTCMEGCLRDGYGAENENCVYCCPPFMGPEYFDEESFQECPR